EPKWAENLELNKLPVNTVIEIVHFEYRLNDPQNDEQKKILINRLLERENTQLAAVMKVPPSPDEYGMFRPLEVIDLREEPLHWKKLYEGQLKILSGKSAARCRLCGPSARNSPKTSRRKKLTQRKQLPRRSWSGLMVITT